MPAHDERISNRANKKWQANSNVARTQIPPPHLHSQSQLYLQPNVALGTDATHPQDNNDHDHFGHFVSEHEIKFTRNEVCTPSTCICFFIAFLFSFMAIMSGIYYGLNLFDGKQVKERVFKVQFAVFDLPSANLENAESKEFKTLSWSMKQQIDALFAESSLSKSYIKSEIVAFERKPSKPSEVIVHFNVHVTSSRRNVDASEIYLVLADELANNRLRLFAKWSIEHNSLDVQERKWPPREKSALLVNPWTYKSIFPGMLEGLSTEPTPAPRKCMALGLEYCRFLTYNLTSYPTWFNHWNLSSVEEDFITYKEIIDSECYPLAREFLCTLLQPECVQDEIVLPCRSFCAEFYNACHRWLPEKVASKMVCSTFPDGVSKGNRKLAGCRGKPKCAASLRIQQSSSNLRCDGIYDCDDHSDELGCNYCDADNQFHCGNQKCVTSFQVCDGIKNCANGADEANCLTLLSDTRRLQKDSSLSEGYLMASYKGRDSLVCSEPALTHMANNYSHVYNNNQLQILGLNICNERHFEELIQIESKHVSLNGPFSKFVPGTTLISPYPSQCKNREIYYVECAIPKCGINLANWEEIGSAVHGPSKAYPGYWPWFTKINLNGNYICDGTLISMDTVLAQSTCFNMERHTPSNHNLSVTLGSVRYQHDNTEARQFSVSQVSPIIGADLNQKLHLMRLSVPINSSRYIRSVCQQKDVLVSISNYTSLNCVVLSVNYQLDQLQSRPVQIVDIERCHDQLRHINGTTWPLEGRRTRHKLCAQIGESEWPDHCGNHVAGLECAGYGNAGRHLFCQFKSTWHLFAVESPTASGKPNADLRHFLLFDTLSKLNV